MKSNASLSYFIPDSQKVYQDVYYSANNRALGDAANDIVINQNRAYIVVNNSHKIEVVSTETNKSLGTIQLPNKSPRRIVIYNSNLGYVSNWNDNSITVFNPTTLEIIKIQSQLVISQREWQSQMEKFMFVILDGEVIAQFQLSIQLQMKLLKNKCW